ncbi:MAG: hypothetical protein IPO53_14190 [Chitinophagaceae bacterium]|nr:hypothetical protein [Chitinophagaceae bacterium]
MRQYTGTKTAAVKTNHGKRIGGTEGKERITADLHDDVGATLSSMHIYGDLAGSVWDTQPQQSREMVNKISDQSKELMTTMSDIVWSLKSPADEKNGFALRLKNYSQDLLSGKGIITSFEIDNAIAEQMTNPVARKNLLLIAKEAINNIAKYSAATQVIIKLYRKDKELFLTLNDNGKGFDKDQILFGNGLNNIESRCRQLNGTCAIETGPQAGVFIACRFPIAIISHSG